jgi:broad specificity phosphatase PhoE
MRIFNFILIIFITLTSSIKAELNTNVIKELKKGNKLIFVRHAYAPGGGDPENFNIKECATQRNLGESGKQQAKRIGDFFTENQIPFEQVYSSEWCRCKDTASIAFKKFKTKNFLNSFFNPKFSKNKNTQMKKLKKFVKNSQNSKNIIFVTHYVVISEVLSYAAGSGEIVISDKQFNKIDSIQINY